MKKKFGSLFFDTLGEEKQYPDDIIWYAYKTSGKTTESYENIVSIRKESITVADRFGKYSRFTFKQWKDILEFWKFARDNERFSTIKEGGGND